MEHDLPQRLEHPIVHRTCGPSLGWDCNPAEQILFYLPALGEN